MTFTWKRFWSALFLIAITGPLFFVAGMAATERQIIATGWLG